MGQEVGQKSAGSGLQAPMLAGADLRDRRDPRPVIRREIPYRGMVWSVQRDTFDLGEGGVVQREYLEHPGAVIAIPYREVQGRPQILLINQYRHPVGTFEWELPAGLLDVAGSPRRPRRPVNWPRRSTSSPGGGTPSSTSTPRPAG